jgi:hypothetical protein
MPSPQRGTDGARDRYRRAVTNMLPFLQVLTLMLVALAAALAVAHALELPGKMRLDRETYLAVQRIYYPGFTIGGAAEPLGAIATAALALLTPFGSIRFWLMLAAFAGLVGMMAVFWLVTQPVNKYWVTGQDMGALGAGFFRVGTDRRRGADWTELRDRWEYSHLARAALASGSLLALATSLTLA